MCCLTGNENLMAAAAVASAFAAFFSLIVAIKANRRENRLCNAANLVLELSLVDAGNSIYKITVFNDGNACAKELEINVEKDEEIKDENGCVVKNKKSFDYHYLGVLRKATSKEVSIKIDSFPNEPIYVIARWKDDFNKFFKHRMKCSVRKKGKNFDSKRMTIDDSIKL